MEVINRKRAGDVLYLAGGPSPKKVLLYAEHQAEAQQRAVEHFRPKKKERGLVWVQLAQSPIATESL